MVVVQNPNKNEQVDRLANVIIFADFQTQCLHCHTVFAGPACLSWHLLWEIEGKYSK